MRSVEALYRFIEEMLSHAIASKDVTVEMFDVDVTEDFIGSYKIPALVLTIGRERVEFHTKGVTLIGARAWWMFAVAAIPSL